MITMQGNIHLAVYVLAYLFKVNILRVKFILLKRSIILNKKTKKQKKNFIPLKHHCQSKHYTSILLETSSYFIDKDYFKKLESK